MYEYQDIRNLFELSEYSIYREYKRGLYIRVFEYIRMLINAYAYTCIYTYSYTHRSVYMMIPFIDLGR